MHFSFVLLLISLHKQNKVLLTSLKKEPTIWLAMSTEILHCSNCSFFYYFIYLIYLIVYVLCSDNSCICIHVLVIMNLCIYKNQVFVFPSSRNKDHYVGDWVQDRRQGSGELRCTDGTIYDVSHIDRYVVNYIIIVFIVISWLHLFALIEIYKMYI